MVIIIALLMAAGALTFPILTDIRKHGRDNILARSGREILELPPFVAISNSFKITVDRTVHGAKSLAIIIVAGALLIWIVRLILRFLF
jgi:hypothetical protein